MKLTRTERWILANQYRILEALYPDEAKALSEARAALEQGYELHYQWIAERVYADEHAMTTEECREALDVLDLFRALKRSYEALSDKSGIELRDIQFMGFDGNNETKYVAYIHYFCGLDGGRFTELDRGDNFNAHMLTLEIYRRMGSEWERCGRSNTLSKEEIIRIVSARHGRLS